MDEIVFLTVDKIEVECQEAISVPAEEFGGSAEGLLGGKPIPVENTNAVHVRVVMLRQEL
ncbi:hypothetical protein ACVIWU_006727 [Bradyrhizobium sp. USDA 4509]